MPALGTKKNLFLKSFLCINVYFFEKTLTLEQIQITLIQKVVIYHGQMKTISKPLLVAARNYL